MVWIAQEFMKFEFIKLPERGEAAPLELGWKHLFVTLWRELFLLIRANLCFLLFCLPVVTIPAACCTLHGICVDAIRGRGVHVLKAYWGAVKELFLPAWGAFLCLGAGEAVAITGAVFYLQRAAQMPLLLVPGLMAAAIAVVGLLMHPYVWTMLSRVDLGLREVLKNAFLLVFLNLKFSVCGGVICLLLIVLQAVFLLRAVPVILTISLALTAYFGTYFSLYGVQQYILTEEL